MAGQNDNEKLKSFLQKSLIPSFQVAPGLDLGLPGMTVMG